MIKFKQFIKEAKNELDALPYDHPKRKENLMKWFSNSVTHDNGVPRTYYTGTSKDTDFKSHNVGRHGAWFTSSPHEASQYSVENDSMGSTWSHEKRGYEKTNVMSRVIPAHIKAENPYRGPIPDYVFSQNYKKSQSDWFDTLRAKGHDSWIPDHAGGNLVVVLKHPNQIKSSIGNKGHFDADKKNIHEEINNHYTHLPDEPGTVQIPDGHIRLYHRTSINNMKSITKNGLSINNAKGYEGPKAIYADPKGFYGKPGDVGDETVDVEFHVPKDKFRATIVYMDEVPKENIIAIHQNWHNTARSIRDNPKTLSRVLSGKHDNLLDGSGGDQYKYSIKHIKHIFKESKIPHDRDTSENTTSLDKYFDIIEQMVIELSEIHNVDPDIIWDDFENVDDVELYETAAWRRKEGKSETGGLNKKGVESYRRENPGSNLQMAVTTKPSELKKDSKAYKRRKSFCARMSGMNGPMKKPNGEPTRKALALRKWNC